MWLIYVLFGRMLDFLTWKKIVWGHLRQSLQRYYQYQLLICTFLLIYVQQDASYVEGAVGTTLGLMIQVMTINPYRIYLCGSLSYLVQPDIDFQPDITYKLKQF